MLVSNHSLLTPLNVTDPVQCSMAKIAIATHPMADAALKVRDHMLLLLQLLDHVWLSGTKGKPVTTTHPAGHANETDRV